MILFMMVISVFHKHFAIPVHVAPFIVKQSTNGSFASLATLVVIGLASAVTMVTTGLVTVVTVVVIGRKMANALVVVVLVRVVILVARRVTGVVIGVVSLHTVFKVPLMRYVNVLKMIPKCVSGFLAGTRV